MIVGIAHLLVVTQAVTIMDAVKMDTLLLQLALQLGQQRINIQPIVISMIIILMIMTVGIATTHHLAVTQAILITDVVKVNQLHIHQGLQLGQPVHQ